MQARLFLRGARRGRGLVLAALLMAGTPRAQAAAPTPAEATRPVAPLPGPATAPALRRPVARLRALRTNPDLTYHEARAEPAQAGLLQRLLHWLARLLGGIQSTRSGRVTWNVVVYGLALGMLVFAVLKLLQLDVARLFGRAARAGGLGYTVGGEDIHALDFGAALAQAEAAGQLRLAVRLGYLQLLKQLTDQHLIDWQPDKTNQAYLRELAAARPDLRPAFAELTRQFEYVWYGEWALGAASYPPLRAQQQLLGRAL
ncbi:MAG: DUF4129 domain-containing protein [Janthinobacterium lividum]